MEETYYEVRTFKNNQATGIFPSQFASKEEAIAFVTELNSLDTDSTFEYRIYKVTETLIVI